MISYKSLLLAYIVIVSLISYSCSTSNSNGSTAEYETAWFSYPNEDRVSRTNVCEVRYYVNGDTLFTSEKYFFVTLGYTDDNDPDRHYMEMVYFDKKQEPNADGWYYVVFDRDDIVREPHTHLSSIILRSYIGDKYDYANPDNAHTNAYLYNATDFIHAGQDRNQLSPQLKKLLPVIE